MFTARRKLLSALSRSFQNDNWVQRTGDLPRRNRKYYCEGPELVKVKPVRLSFSCYEVVPPVVEDRVPVIIMHGLFGNRNNWSSIAKAIHHETGKRVFALDARNHGDSPHSDKHTYVHLAEDVKSFMDDHEIEAGALVGHSMGGRALMTFAMLYPQRVESLAIVDISPVGNLEGINDMKKIFSALKSIDLNAYGFGLYDYRKRVEMMLAETLQDEKLAQFLSMNLVEKGNGKFGWKVNVDSLADNYGPHITLFPIKSGQFSGPTVFICGENSNFVDFSKVDEIKQFFPEAFFMTVGSAGHWVHVDQPRQFLQILSVFIKRFRMK